MQQEIPSKIVAVNLGSGPQVAPGWQNFDNSPNLRLSKIPYARWVLWKAGVLSKPHYDVKWPESVRYRQLTSPLPFADGLVDYIYTSHFLEHIYLSDAQKILRETYRVLKTGGVARIIVPDLNYYIREYLKNLTDRPEEAGDLFMKAMNIHAGQRDPHLWMYDTDSMSKQLKNAGFSTIENCAFKQGKCKDIDILDNRPIDSLFIEATKS